MQPRTRAQRQRDAAAAAAGGGPGADEAMQREWAAQREHQQQQKVIERLQEQEQNLRQLETLAAQEDGAINFDLQRQIEQQRAAIEREQQIHNVQLPRQQTQRVPEKPQQSGIPRPAAFGNGGPGLFGAPTQGQPVGGGLFGLGPGEAPAPAPAHFFGEAPSAAAARAEQAGPPQMSGNGQGASPAENVPPWLAGPAQARPPAALTPAPAPMPGGYAPGRGAPPVQGLSDHFSPRAPAGADISVEYQQRDDNHRMRRDEFMRRKQQQLQQQAVAPGVFSQEPVLAQYPAPYPGAQPSHHQPQPGSYDQQIGGAHAAMHGGQAGLPPHDGAPLGQYQQAPQRIGWMEAQQQQLVGMQQHVSFQAPAVETYLQEPAVGSPRMPSSANRPPTGFVHGVAPDSPSRGVIPFGDTAPRERQLDAKLAYGEELRRQAEEDRLRHRENKLADKPQWLNPSSPQGQQQFGGQAAAPDGIPHWQHEQLSRPVHQAHVAQQPQHQHYVGSVLPMGSTTPKDKQLDAKLAYGEELRRQAEEDKMRRKGRRMPDKPQWMTPAEQHMQGEQRQHWQHEQLAPPMTMQPLQHQQHRPSAPWDVNVGGGGGMLAGLGEDRSHEQMRRQQQQAAAEYPEKQDGAFSLIDDGRPLQPAPMSGRGQAYANPYPSPSFAPESVKASGLADFGQNSGLQEQRRRKQQEMKEMLAQQVIEAQRKKEEAKRKQKEEEEREMERIKREQAEEKARLDAEKAKEEEKKRLLEEERRQAAEAAQARRDAAKAAERAEELAAEAAAKAATTPQSRPGTRENRRQKRVGIKEGDDPPAPPPFVQSGRSPIGQRVDLFGPAPGDEPPAQSDLFGPPPGAPAPARPDLFGPPPGAAAPAHPDFFRPSPTNAGPPGPPFSGASGPVSGAPPPGNDWLNGIMQQQQELYRQQQDALSRLQDEAGRLRQEKEDAQNNLLELKTKQLEEKEREVKKLQKQFQRQVLLQGGPNVGTGAASSSLDAALHMLLPDAAGTSSSSPSNGKEENSYGPGAFYSKYEQETPAMSAAEAEDQQDSNRLEKPKVGRNPPWTRGASHDVDANMTTSQTSGLEDGWSVAPLPWEEDRPQEGDMNAAALAAPADSCNMPDPAGAEDRLLGVGAPGSVQALRRHSMQDSLFEDSWGPALNDSMVEGVHPGHEPSPPDIRVVKDTAVSASISGTFGVTLAGDSKLVCAADAANRTWRDGHAPRLLSSEKLAHSARFMSSMGSELQASTRPVAISFSEDQSDSAVCASASVSPPAAPVTAALPGGDSAPEMLAAAAAPVAQSASESLGPMAELEAAVRAIREARGDYAGPLSPGLSAQLSTSHGLHGDLAAVSIGTRSLETDLGAIGQVESSDRGSPLGPGTMTFGSIYGHPAAQPDLSKDNRQDTGASWGKVLRQFRGSAEDVSRQSADEADLTSLVWQSGPLDSGDGASGSGMQRRRRVSRERHLADESTMGLDEYKGSMGNSQELRKPAEAAGAALADSLDMFQAGSVSSSTCAQPITTEDFTAIASEDFDAFIARLQKKAEFSPNARALPSHEMFGASPSAAVGAAAVPLRPSSNEAYSSRPPVAGDCLASVPGALRRERVRTGSPVLRSAASSVLRSGSKDARPLSGSSTGSRPGSASKMPSLKELRQQRRKPRTEEDVSLPSSSAHADDATASIADGGLGLRLNLTAMEHRGSCPEPGSLQALRAARPPSQDRRN